MANSIDIALNAIDNASKILAKTGDNIYNLGKAGESANKGLKTLNEEMVRLIQQERASAVTKQAADAISFLTEKEKLAIIATAQLADANQKTRLSFTEINQAIELGKKAIEALKEVYNFAKEGAQVDRLRDSFETLGKSEQDLIKLRQASLGTIDDYNIMLSTNRAKLLGVSTATDDLATLLQVAAVRGRAMGLDTTQAFNDIVTGIGRASPMILDNLGIVTGGEQTYADFAKSIGKTTESLSAAEKRQALFNKVVQDSKSLGPLVADQATKFERLDAQIKNVGDSLKEFAADAISPILTDFQQMAVVVDSTRLASERLAAAQDVAANGTLRMKVEVLDYIPQLQAQVEAEQAVAMTLEEKSLRQNMASISTLVYADDVRDLRDSLHEAASQEEINKNVLEAHKNAERDAASAAREHATAQEAVRKELAETSIYVGDMANKLFDLGKKELSVVLAQQAIKGLKDAVNEGKISEDEYAEAVKQVQLANGLATEKTYAMADGVQLATNLLNDGKITAGDYATAINNVEKGAADGKVSIEDLGVEVKLTGDMFATQSKYVDQFRDSAYDAATAEREAAKSAETLYANIGKLKDKTITITTVYKTQGSPPAGSGGGYASGGSFIVPPGYSESAGRPYMVPVQSGEKVTVETPAQQRVNNMTMNVYAQSAPNVVDEFNTMRAMLGA